MRLVFLGTPAFAVPTLDAVAREHEVVLVVAQPDKPAGRGMKLQMPPVAARAKELGLPLLQPARVRDEAFLDELRRLAPDAGVVVAYGKILPAAMLEIPTHGFLNVHASILPRWRGAAPIQRAIEVGDPETGVTIMRIDEELDHGPMLATVKTPVSDDERTPQLAERLSMIGGAAMARVLRDLEKGMAIETPQDHARATLAPKIEKEEGLVTMREPAKTIYDRFRAFDPWPGVFLDSGGERLRLTGIRRSGASGEPRTILEIADSVIVAAGEQSIEILEMQRPGKSRAPAAALARGLGWREGEPIP
jgi:methionyl-tRNA formyltransferase